MDFNIVNKNDELVMALIHYFITEENYTPIVVKGVDDEVWLENLDAPYRIIRINSNYIHNEEQYKFDIYKTKNVLKQIKRKTLSFNMNILNIFLNLSDDVSLKQDMKNIASVKYNDLEEVLEDKELNALYPRINTKLLSDIKGIDLLVNVTSDINAKTIRDNETYKEIFKPKKMIVTPIIMGICVFVFILMHIFGKGSTDISTLINYGASYRKLVKVGQVWRLVSAIFIHIGLIHLICNMYAISILGVQIEKFLGKYKYLIVFIGSGVIGTFLQVLLSDTVYAGTSGAIFGLLGSLLYFGYNYRLYLGNVLRRQVIPIIILNLFLGIVIPGVDIFAQLGGLVGGYLITSILGIPGKTKKDEQINSGIVLVILIVFLSIMLIRY